MREENLLKAIKYFGSQKKLAGVLGVSQQVVNSWVNCGNKVPYVYALKIAIYSEGTINIDDLNSDEKEITSLLKNALFSKDIPVSYVELKKISKGNRRCPIYRDIQEIPSDRSRPVLVDCHGQLIACECRLRGYRSETSKVKVYKLSIKNMLKNSFNIDFFINDFSISERVEIGLFVEKELGNRRGKRMDLELPQNSAEVKTGEETRRLATKLSGFGSHFTYSQAKEVLRRGVPEVIKAMDDGLLAVSKARQIASLPYEEQLGFIEIMNKKVTK